MVWPGKGSERPDAASASRTRRSPGSITHDRAVLQSRVRSDPPDLKVKGAGVPILPFLVAAGRWGLLTPEHSAALSITSTKVVDTSTPIPEGTESFGYPRRPGPDGASFLPRGPERRPHRVHGGARRLLPGGLHRAHPGTLHRPSPRLGPDRDGDGAEAHGAPRFLLHEYAAPIVALVGALT